jgi:hypothetical protein
MKHTPYAEKDCKDCFPNHAEELEKAQEEYLRIRNKIAKAIMQNIADGFDERGHFLQKFARMFCSATEKNKECLLPAAHRLIEAYDIEKGQKEKGILTEVQYM